MKYFPVMNRLLKLAVFTIILHPITASAQSVSYPHSARIDVVDNYHGTSVTDSYRWLEALDSGEVTEWVSAQNAVSRPYLASLSGAEGLKERITELWDYERYSVPFTAGGKYYFFDFHVRFL